jgi:type I restriction enzyme S subunit
MSKYKKYPQYKDSGVEWLGEIPNHWHASKLKYHSIMYNGNSISDSQKSDYENQDASLSIPYVSTKDLNAKYFTIEYDNG